MIKLKQIALAASMSAAVIAWPTFADQGKVPQKMPRLDHVFLIMMENHSYSEIYKSPNAPFITALAESANLATNYLGVGHPSLTNYLEVVGGSNFGIESDNPPNWHGLAPGASKVNPIAGTGTDLATVSTTNPSVIEFPAAPYVGKTIADQLVAAGKSWKSYQESLPATGLVDGVNNSDGIYSNLNFPGPGTLQNLYAVKHNPFVYFTSVQEGYDPNNGFGNVVDFNGIHGFYADLRAGKAPNFSFIAPNQCHDMHGIGNGSAVCGNDATLLQMGDATVQQLVTAIKASDSWEDGNNAIIVMWDENDFKPTANQVPTIVETNYGVHGVASARPYNHFSLLKTLEAGFGLPCLNHACDKNVSLMTDMFGTDREQHHDGK